MKEISLMLDLKHVKRSHTKVAQMKKYKITNRLGLL